MAGKRARRGHGEGSIYQRGDGYWVGSVEAGRCPGGHQRKDGTICKGGERRRARVVRRTKNAVIAELAELKRRGAAGVAGMDPTVDEYMTWWLDTVKASSVSPESLADYRRWHKDRISPHVGHIRLRKLTAFHVQAMMNTLEAHGESRRKGQTGMSPKARNAARTLLSGALKHARGLRLVPDNVADYVSGAKVGTKLDDALDKNELELCLKAASGDRLYALLDVSATLGNREGEMLSLTWDDLDLDDKGEFRVDEAKTPSGERTLPLVAGTWEVMKAHRDLQDAEKAEAGQHYQDHGLVFCKPDGRPMSGRELLTWWYRIQNKAGVTRRRWHALRHSAAQRMLDRGVPLEIVSAILGHNGIAITADIYGRATADRIRKMLAHYDDPGGDDG